MPKVTGAVSQRHRGDLSSSPRSARYGCGRAELRLGDPRAGFRRRTEQLAGPETGTPAAPLRRRRGLPLATPLLQPKEGFQDEVRRLFGRRTSSVFDGSRSVRPLGSGGQRS